eukprot:GHVU01113219.1.p3 GENE.GHVU01113219.1~~GHVU01113219.1.p3  ORF type:complete len:106 (-),score=12.78 GHVU01113219.1:457-774(-)
MLGARGPCGVFYLLRCLNQFGRSISQPRALAAVWYYPRPLITGGQPQAVDAAQREARVPVRRLTPLPTVMVVELLMVLLPSSLLLLLLELRPLFAPLLLLLLVQQ